jgi:hypothetical protein
MKTNERIQHQGKVAVAAACLSMAWLLWSGANIAGAQTAPANLSPGLQEVVKLTQAKMGDDVITTYIKNSGQAYTLSADDILYLNSQGVSQAVITTLMQSKAAAPPMQAATPPNTANPSGVFPQPTPATPAPPPVMTPPAQPDAYVPPAQPLPGAGIDLNYFQNQLAPYGNWVDVPPYGPAWRPTVAMDPAWRPYFNGGHWEYTDSGWYWQSDYPYGDIVFHYGRWLRDFRYGWVWIPGYQWAPAWVAWRQADAYAGWAPLPPAAYFEPGVGLMYRGRFGLDVDFGLGYDDFVFVGYDHFWAPDYHAFLAPRILVRDQLFGASLVINNYSFGPDGRFVVEGLGRDHMALLTHHDIRSFNIVIRDARIMQARTVERAFVVNRIKDIRSRPANDPLRRAVEDRDAAVRRGPVPAERGRAVVPDRGPAIRATEPGRGAPDARAIESGRGAPDARTPEAGRGVPESRTPDAETRGAERGSGSKDSKDK